MSRRTVFEVNNFRVIETYPGGLCRDRWEFECFDSEYCSEWFTHLVAIVKGVFDRAGMFRLENQDLDIAGVYPLSQWFEKIRTKLTSTYKRSHMFYLDIRIDLRDKYRDGNLIVEMSMTYSDRRKPAKGTGYELKRFSDNREATSFCENLRRQLGTNISSDNELIRIASKTGCSIQ